MNATLSAPRTLGVLPIHSGLWAVASATPGHAPYLVTATANDAGRFDWTCSCPHCSFHPEAFDKHIEAVQAHSSARSFVPRCVICGMDRALPDDDRCVGCKAVYPFGQDDMGQQMRAMLRDADLDAYIEARAAAECETEEPPFAEQEEAAGIYDAGHTTHNGTRLFVAADPFAGYLPL